MAKKPKLKPVRTLMELRNKARTDERYAKLLLVANSNLGGRPEASLDEAYQNLCDNACAAEDDIEGEPSEDGIVAEVNFCIDLID